MDRKLLQLSYNFGSKFSCFNNVPCTVKRAVGYADNLGMKVVKSRAVAGAASFYNKTQPTLLYNPQHPRPVQSLLILHEAFHHLLGHNEVIGENRFDAITKEQEEEVDTLATIAIIPLSSALEKPHIRYKRLPHDMKLARVDPDRFSSFIGADELPKKEVNRWIRKRADIYNRIIQECSKEYCNGRMNCLSCNVGRSFYKFDYYCNFKK